jgi:hypothetical protein
VIAPAPLADDRREHVARYARSALQAANAMGRIPTPLDEVRAALHLATPQELFDLGDAPPELARRLRRLFGKVKGAFAVRERMIYLDREQGLEPRRFVYGHEIGHDALPWHRDAYYCDDNRALDPDTDQELEAEASAFSADLLFNLGTFTEQAHASRIGLAPALELAGVYATSRHSAIRRYVEDGPRPVALLVLGRFSVQHNGARALRVIRGIESASFRHRYGRIEGCFPTMLHIQESPIARDALRALQGRLSVPILTGDVNTDDSATGRITLNYEIYSNSYQCFVLLTPHRRIAIGTPVRAAWTAAL